MMRKLALGLYVLGLSLATPVAALDQSLLTGTMSGLQVQAPVAAPTATYATFDGGQGQLSDYAGEIVVLNFWATWCGPCRAEMPSLQALQDELGDDGLEVVTMAFGRHNPVQMQRFWDDAGITSLPLHLDAGTELARALGVKGLPHTFVLDRDGQVIAQLTGEADWAAPETIALFQSLLAE